MYELCLDRSSSAHRQLIPQYFNRRCVTYRGFVAQMQWRIHLVNRKREGNPVG